jgi:5-methylthioadenosine/S-adenosylhomocysteine deaminase
MLVRGASVVTMDSARNVLTNAAVVVRGSTIAAVGYFDEMRRNHPNARVLGDSRSLVTPGYVNTHQHLTGDRLVQSCIPDAIDSHEAIFGWAVPVHRNHTADDDELSATLAAVAAVTNGITCTVEAGTVAHPDRVVNGLKRVGLRGTIGRWGWDADNVPYTAPAAEVIEAATDLLDRFPPGGLVEAWVTLVGHDLMSDELVVAASELAQRRATRLTFHMSPHGGDPARFVQRTGVRPLVHLNRLGVLGEHVLLAHAVHLDDNEVDVVLRTRAAIASCPWAYVRLAQGFHLARHAEIIKRGGRVGLGCDAENAGDAVDILRAATLFAGFARDLSLDPRSFTADDALSLATIGGAQAIGMSSAIGSIEVGKRADLVVHDTAASQWVPRSTSPVQQLIWASDGRSVQHVVIDGRVVVENGRCVTVDIDSLRHEAEDRRDHLLRLRER